MSRDKTRTLTGPINHVLTRRDELTGELVTQLDGGFYNAKVVAACRRAGARFSITTRNDAAIRRAIAGIDEAA